LTVASGQPYTPVVGKVQDGGGNLADPYSDVINIQGRRYSSRLPLYIRGDIGWIRDISPFGIKGKFKANIVNFTNRYNVLLYEWDHNKWPSEVTAYSMFSIVPTIGIEFEL